MQKSSQFRMLRPVFTRCILLSALVITMSYSAVYSQRGAIIRSATTTVMDPNRDGFVSKTASGFSNDGYYVDEFELPMFGIPKLDGDVAGDNVGKNCGITDLTPDINGFSVYATLDGNNNLIFRFRVGDDAPSVEAWTILLDTDGKMGSEDPNATTTNPGFEIDITLIKKNNSGVLVYNIDGIEKCPQPLLFYEIASHFQIAIADEVSCGDPDYFYDFYVPFADVASAFNIDLNAPLRFVAVSNVSATCAMDGKISDIAGVDNNDAEYSGCDSCAFLDLINTQCPSAIADLCETCAGFEKDKVSAPLIDVPVRQGQTRVSGSTIESDIFIRIEIYTNTAPPGGTPAWGTVPRVNEGVYATGNIWSVDLDPLLAYDSVVATSQKDEFSQPCGSGNSVVAMVTVVKANTAPVALDQSVNVSEDTQVAITLTGTDPENDPLVYTIATLPARGSLTGSPPTVAYMPFPNYSGPDSFTFHVNDGIFRSETPGTVSIQVVPVNDKPVSNNLELATPEDTPVAATLTASDIDGDPLVFTIITLPAHGTLTGSLPDFTYTPDANYFGQDKFTFRVNDGQENSNTATVSITISPVGGDAPVANDQSITTPEDTAIGITLTGSDPDLDPLTYTIVSAPSNGTLTGTAPNVTYNPGANYSGSDSFTFHVNDGTLTSATATVSITVTPVDDDPVASDQSVTTPEDTPVDFTLSVSNPDNDPLTYTIVSPPSHGTLTGAAPDLSYTPDPDYYGPDSFTFKVNNGFVDSNTATVSITVSPVGGDAPVANDQNVTTAEDTQVAISLTGSDPDAEPLTYSIVTAPSSGTLAGTAPNVTYRPNTNYSGSDSFTFIVSDGTLNSAPATVSITISPVNDAPVAFSRSVAYDLDTPKPITLTASDVDGDPLTFSVTLQPSNGTLSGTAPDLTYTPDPGFSGSDSFKFIANDGTTSSNEATISLNLTLSSNVAPVASDQNITVDEDTPSQFLVTATDGNGDDLTYVITQVPANGTVSGSGPAFIYTPNIDYNGVDSFRFQASDGSLSSNEATVSITVTAVNDAPVANSQIVSTDEDTPVTIALTGSDIEGSPLTFEIVTSPSHGTVSLNGATATYAPDLNFNGTDAFSFRVSDGSLYSPATTVSVTVNPVNDAPVATDQDASTPEDSPVVITLNATDVDSPLTFVITQAPLHGSLIISGQNVTYTPEPDYYGDDSFKFTASDGSLSSNEGTVNISVSAVNDPPIAFGQNVTVSENTQEIFTLTGSDTEGSTLSFSVVSAPAHGTLSLSGATATYTPELNYSGTDSFTFLVNDGVLNSGSATVAILINSAGSPPVAVSESHVTTMEDTSVDVDLSQLITDSDGDGLTFYVIDQPLHGAVVINGTVLTYTPDPDYHGDDGFTIYANDGISDSNTGSVLISILPVNDAPVARDQDISTDEDVPVNVILTADDPDGTTFSYTLVATPAHGTLTGTAPALTYTPKADFNGSDEFTFKVNDGFTGSNTASVRITVKPVNDDPVISPLTALPATKEDSVLQICLNVVDVDGDKVTFQDPVNTKGGGSMTRQAAPFDFCYIFSPPPNYNGESVWNTIVIDDAGRTATTVAGILIIPVNDPPVALNDYGTVKASSTLSVDVLGNDLPIAGPFKEFYDIYETDSADVLTISAIVKGPSHGSVSLAEDNRTIGYKPGAYTFIGADSVTYQVCDSGHPALCATATFFIQVTDNDFDFKIYQGVSPNNDGLNDYLHIDGIHRYKKNLVRIFDRFNNMVYEISGYDNEGNRWDGQSNRGLGGTRLPDGTYFYTIFLEDIGKLHSGYVVLKGAE